MNITSTILNQYVARHRTSTPLSNSSGGGCRSSSPSLSDGGRKWPAGKEPTKSWMQRAFSSTLAPAPKTSSSTKRRRKRRRSKPAVDHEWEKKDTKAPVVPGGMTEEPTIRFTKPSVEEGAKVFKFCLVGKFPGRRPSLEQIRGWARSEWKLRGEWSVTLLDRSHVFIRIDNEDDMVRVWPRSRCFVCGKLMKVFKWAPTFFTATASEPSSAAVWISLPSLPVVLFQEKFLYQVAGLLGKVVAMDSATRNLSRTNVARVCVEVDLAKTLPDRVRIEIGDVGFWQDVVYERLPYYCTHCSRQGHSTDICKFSKVSDEKGDDAHQEKVGSISTPNNLSLPNVLLDQDEQALLDLRAQTCPAILNKSGKKKRVTTTDGHVHPAAADSREKKQRGKSLVAVEEVTAQDEPSKEHKSGDGMAMAIDNFQNTGEEIETSIKELDQSVDSGTSMQMLDTDLPKKDKEIDREENEGTEKAQESQLVVTEDEMNVTRTITKCPTAWHRLRLRSSILFWKRRRSKGFNDFPASTSIYSSSLPVGLCRRFTFVEMKRATNNFDLSLKIGEGGFGSVFRGRFEGVDLAIKRHNSCSNQGRQEFETELNVLSKLRHKNLVTLIGYCTDNNEMMLVYEFAARGNFEELSYGSSERLLTWTQTIETCLGAAKGLRYLHENGVIHRDVTSRNILVSQDYDAKISDLGLGRPEPDSGNSATAVAGTFGYLDPEYFFTWTVTRKSDVYSFGVVLFEVLCGKPPISRDLPHDQSLVLWALRSLENGNAESIADPRLRGCMQVDCLKKYVELATSCVSEGRVRPTMEEVVNKLELAIELQESNADCRHRNS